MNNSALSMFLSCAAFNLGKLTVDLLPPAGSGPGTEPLPLLPGAGAGAFCGNSGLLGRIFFSVGEVHSAIITLNAFTTF